MDQMALTQKVAVQPPSQLPPRLQVQEAIMKLKEQEVLRLQAELQTIQEEKTKRTESITTKQKELMNIKQLVNDRKGHLEAALARMEAAEL